MTEENEVDAPPEGKALGKGHRPSILLIDGPLAGKVFEIPEHRQLPDGSPADHYWFGLTADIRDKWTDDTETVSFAAKYELDPVTHGYRFTERADPEEVEVAWLLDPYASDQQ